MRLSGRVLLVLRSKHLSELSSLFQNRRFIKDPIHGVIQLNNLEARLIDSPLLIRLHGVKQLGFTYLVYPQAKHSRFEHSLGSMHTAGVIANTLLTNSESELRELLAKEHDKRLFVELFRISALLHDLGHLPYSHATEMAITKGIKEGLIEGKILEDYEFSLRKGLNLHEAITCRLIKNLIENVKIKGRLSLAIVEASLKVLCDEEAHGNWRDVYTDELINIVRSVISGKITDIDKIEYLVRDAYNTGAKFGLIDVERLLSSVKIKEINGKIRIVIPEKLLSNVEDLFYARYMMYKYVYLHHRVIATEVCYEKALKFIAKNWKKIKRSLSPLFQKSTPEFGDIFYSKKIFEWAYTKGILVDDSLIDYILKVAYTKANGDEKDWFEAILLRKKALNTVFKREVAFYSMLRKSFKDELGVDIDPAEAFKELYRHYGSYDSLEDAIANELAKIPGCTYLVRAIPPISADKEEPLYVYGDNVLERIDIVSPFISAIEKAGQAPTVFIYTRYKCADKNIVIRSFIDMISKLLHNRNRHLNDRI